MITKVNVSRQDIEETVSQALTEFGKAHNREPKYLILGRIAYEELRDMQMIGHRDEGANRSVNSFQGLTITVIEDPSNALMIGCEPD